MNTIIFYVLMTVTGIDGANGANGVGVTEEAFEPLSWTYTTSEEQDKAYEECSIIANAYLQLEAVVEVDCYEEVK